MPPYSSGGGRTLDRINAAVRAFMFIVLFVSFHTSFHSPLTEAKTKGGERKRVRGSAGDIQNMYTAALAMLPSLSSRNNNGAIAPFEGGGGNRREMRLVDALKKQNVRRKKKRRIGTQQNEDIQIGRRLMDNLHMDRKRFRRQYLLRKDNRRKDTAEGTTATAPGELGEGATVAGSTPRVMTRGGKKLYGWNQILNKWENATMSSHRNEDARLLLLRNRERGRQGTGNRKAREENSSPNLFGRAERREGCTPDGRVVSSTQQYVLGGVDEEQGDRIGSTVDLSYGNHNHGLLQPLSSSSSSVKDGHACCSLQCSSVSDERAVSFESVDSVATECTADGQVATSSYIYANGGPNAFMVLPNSSQGNDKDPHRPVLEGQRCCSGKCASTVTSFTLPHVVQVKDGNNTDTALWEAAAAGGYDIVGVTESCTCGMSSTSTHSSQQVSSSPKTVRKIATITEYCTCGSSAPVDTGHHVIKGMKFSDLEEQEETSYIYDCLANGEEATSYRLYNHGISPKNQGEMTDSSANTGGSPDHEPSIFDGHRCCSGFCIEASSATGPVMDSNYTINKNEENATSFFVEESCICGDRSADVDVHGIKVTTPNRTEDAGCAAEGEWVSVSYSYHVGEGNNVSAASYTPVSDGHRCCTGQCSNLKQKSSVSLFADGDIYGNRSKYEVANVVEMCLCGVPLTPGDVTDGGGMVERKNHRTNNNTSNTDYGADEDKKCSVDGAWVSASFSYRLDADYNPRNFSSIADGHGCCTGQCAELSGKSSLSRGIDVDKFGNEYEYEVASGVEMCRCGLKGEGDSLPTENVTCSLDLGCNASMGFDWDDLTNVVGNVCQPQFSSSWTTTEVNIEFKNRCGAIVNTPDAYGFGFGNSSADAMYAAMFHCRKHDGPNSSRCGMFGASAFCSLCEGGNHESL